MGEMIQFSHGSETFEGYIASPAAPGPGVIVLQEWWGLVGHIKGVANRFAQAGFNALAPDLYRGKSTGEPDEAGSLMMALNISETELQLRAAVVALKNHPMTVGERVGVIGFCMGGQLSMFAACTNPDIGACINFYGVHPNVKPDFHSLQCPMQGHFAENDAYASPEAVAQLSQQLGELGKAHEFHSYPGTQHAFFNDEREQVYDSTASTLAWERSVSFLAQHLTPSFPIGEEGAGGGEVSKHAE